MNKIIILNLLIKNLYRIMVLTLFLWFYLSLSIGLNDYTKMFPISLILILVFLIEFIVLHLTIKVFKKIIMNFCEKYGLFFERYCYCGKALLLHHYLRTNLKSSNLEDLVLEWNSRDSEIMCSHCYHYSNNLNNELYERGQDY